MEYYDLIIVGAGPAGLCLARELAGSKIKILLIDKKKNSEDVAYNTSGSFLNPEEWKLPESIFYSISSLYFSSKNEAIAKQGFGRIINRRKLLSFMELEATRNENLHIDYGSLINVINAGSKGIEQIVYKKSGKEKIVSAKLFADCSGVSNVLGRKLRIPPEEPMVASGIEYLVPLKKEPRTADLFVGSNFDGGYGWIFPVDSQRAIIGFRTFLKSHFSDIEQRLKNMWQIKRVSERCDLNPQERNVAVLRTGKPLKYFTTGNLLIIGDSALQANPLVGEGVRFVMESARIAAKWIIKSIKEDDFRLVGNYDKEWRKKYYVKYKLAFWMQKILKKITQNDKLMDAGVRKLGRLSDKDFLRLLSGDLSYCFLLKILSRNFIKYGKMKIYDYLSSS